MKDDVIEIAQGKASWFGGPDDKGVSASEGLAVLEREDITNPKWRGLFLAHQPPNTTGIARMLNPRSFYLAYRFPHNALTRKWLRENQVWVYSKAHPNPIPAWVVDWGPSETVTDRDVDLSPGLMEALGITTGGQVWVTTIGIVPVGPVSAQSAPSVSAVPTAAPALPDLPVINGMGSLAPGGSPVPEVNQQATPVPATPAAPAPAANHGFYDTVLTGLKNVPALVPLLDTVAIKAHTVQGLLTTPGTGEDRKRWVMDELHKDFDGIVQKAIPNATGQAFLWLAVSYGVDQAVALVQNQLAHGGSWGGAATGEKK